MYTGISSVSMPIWVCVLGFLFGVFCGCCVVCLFCCVFGFFSLISHVFILKICCASNKIGRIACVFNGTLVV